MGRNYVKCGVCGALNPEYADRCRVCGTVFDRDRAVCERCGAYIPRNSAYCPYCGAVFRPDLIPPSPKDRKSGFIKGILTGLIIGALLSLAVLYPILSSSQEDSRDLKKELENLREMYSELSNRYDLLNQSYTLLKINNSEMENEYQKKVEQYNSLLLNYTELSEKYDRISNPPKDMYFIVILYFQTKYFGNFLGMKTHQHWIVLKVSVKDFMKYRAMEHPLLTDYSIAKDYVVVDKYIREIVSMVNSTLVENTKEELVDALMSVAQNKNVDTNESTAYLSDWQYGTYYHIDRTLKYPLETLVMHSGECMDDVILFLSLVKAAGLDGAFLFIPEMHHVMGGVYLDKKPNYSYNPENYMGYYYAEITYYGWKIGELSDEAEGKHVVFVKVD